MIAIMALIIVTIMIIIIIIMTAVIRIIIRKAMKTRIIYASVRSGYQR